jgi:hypothetical protein
LEPEIKSKYTQYPENEMSKDVDVISQKCYYSFRGALGRRFDEGNSCNSDEYTAISFDGDYLNGRDVTNFSLHSISPDACAAQLDVYEEILGGINEANDVITKLGGNTSSAAARARAMRAFYTFLLMDQWGDTPIIDHSLGSDEAVDRSPRTDVAKWIEKELLEIRSDLPTEVNTSTYGKPTYWMATALLAKLYINWNVYTKDVTSEEWSATATNEKLDDCIKACDEIIESGLFDLTDDYKAKFFYNNGPQIKDFIYAMPYDAITAQGLTYARFRTWRQGNTDNGFYSVPMTKSVGGNMVLTPEFAKLFTLPGDRRNDCIAGDATKAQTDIYQYDVQTGMPTTVRNDYKGEPVTFYRDITLKTEDADLNTGKSLVGWCQGYRSIKFFPNIEEYNTQGRNQSNDMPIFRYADIVLEKAEAILRGGTATKGQTAQSLFNEIRSYVNAPTLSTTPTLQDVLDERGREFLDEHWRRNDLIRFGAFENPWGFKHLNPNANKPTNRLWPLSTNVLNKNTNWKQNAGY